MSTLARRVLQKFRSVFGDHALDWFSYAYVVDWLIATAFWLLAGVVEQLPVYEREFSRNDPLIRHGHKKQQISGFINNVVQLSVPLAIFIASAMISRSLVDLHHSALGLWTARGLTQLVTEFLKNRIGRLRPDFMSRCKWDTTLKACTGDPAKILDGRRSFPSGHSSSVFAAMGFLSFWIAGKTAGWCLNAPVSSRSILATKLGRLALTLPPLFFATWVAISRVEDYRHHKEDVIVGGLIGFSTAALSYRIYWPSPFSSRNFIDEVAGKPRMLYSHNERNHSRNNAYELTRLEDEHEAV